MIYAAPFWCPKAKGYKFRPPQRHAVRLAPSVPVKCLPATPSSNCWACVSIALCKTSCWPESCGKDLPPTDADHRCSPFKPVGAVGAPHLVLLVSLAPCVERTVSNTAHLILASDCKGTSLSTYLGPNSQNWDAQDCKSKNEVCSKVHSELHAVLVQCVFAMPLLSCRYIV